MKIGKKKTVEIDAKILSLCLKTADRFTATLQDPDGDTIHDHDGYVPDFMPGEHHGDYVLLDIDIDTGKILNWTPPTREQIENFIEGGDT